MLLKICFDLVCSLCEKEQKTKKQTSQQVTEEGHKNHHNSIRSLSVFKGRAQGKTDALPTMGNTSDEGRGRKLFVFVSMLWEVVHTGLKQNSKGQCCLLFWLPARTCLYDPLCTKKGARGLRRN